MILFETTPPPDPASVVAGWIPLVLLAVMAIACYLLFRSMRHQMRRIDIPAEGVPTRAGDKDSPPPATRR